MFIPLLSLWLMDAKTIGIGKASIIVASFTFVSKAGNALVGGVINKLGLKLSLIIGLFGSSIILLLVTISEMYILIFILMLTLGLFISLYNISLKTHISLMEESERINAYALLNIAVNVGASLGPLLGGLILDWNPKYLLLASMFNYILAGFITLFLPEVKLEINKNSNDKKYTLENRNKGINTFIKFALFSSVFWLLYTQLMTTFPVVFSHYFTGKTIGFFLTINAITIILIQGFYPRIQPYFKNELWYSLAFVLISISFFLLWLKPTFPLVLLAIIIFSVSEVIWVPMLDSELVKNKGSLSAPWAFGFAGIFWGIGESLGSFLGLNIYHYFYRDAFLILTFLSLLIFVIYIINVKVKNNKSQNGRGGEEKHEKPFIS